VFTARYGLDLDHSVSSSLQSWPCHRAGGYSTDLGSIPDHCGVCGVQSGTGTGVLPEYFGFLPSVLFP
jgi:hypothetical protein